MNNKDLLYKKLNALRLEVHSSIVDDIVTTVDDLFGQPNGSKPLVIGSLPSDDEIWECLTRTVCGRDMSGLEPYYKPDLILGAKSLIRKLSGNEIEFKVTGLDEQSYNSLIELLKTIKQAEIISSQNDGKPIVNSSVPYKEDWSPDWKGDPDDPQRWKGW